MNKEKKELEEINRQMKKMKNRKLELIEQIKKSKKKNGNAIKSFPNILRRMSTKFFEQMEFIDKKREEFGFDPLFLPEKTELIVRHNNWWKIKDDIIHFNKEIENNGGIINV